MQFIIDSYGDQVSEFLETNDVAVTFYTDSEFFADSIEQDNERSLSYNDFNVFFYQDYSFESKPIRDINFCTIEDERFIKIVTPFTRPDSYDFIVADKNKIEKVVSLLKNKEEKNRKSNLDFPIIGLDFTDLKKNTIDFLLNEDFRDYCRKKNIKLKRGVVLEGKPGTGKTLSIQWLKQEASKNNINMTSFKNIDEFMNGESEYYSDTKNIFVFEDFDAALMDRKETGETPNQVLAMVLNTLDGIDKIEDVVSIFTTNKINMFDDAFLRPGRIDKVFTYDLPTKEQMREFFEAYIVEEKQFFDDMIHLIENLDGDIPFATLKGICDEINIWKFSESDITFEVIESIIKDKIRRKNALKDKSNYIL